MKRTDLIKRLRQIADDSDVVFALVREGANHEIWSFNGQRLSIPRHREINEYTARGIITTAQQTLEEEQ
jgi:mRNA interferase HicA